MTDGIGGVLLLLHQTLQGSNLSLDLRLRLAGCIFVCLVCLLQLIHAVGGITCAASEIRDERDYALDGQRQAECHGRIKRGHGHP